MLRPKSKSKLFWTAVNEKMDNHTCIYGVNVLDLIKHRYPRIPCFVVFDEAARVRGPIIGGATSGYALNRENYKWSKDNSAEIEKGVIVSDEDVTNFVSCLI